MSTIKTKEQIDEMNPSIFISYSWDSESHKDWVRKLADKLIHDGIHVIIDQYDLRGGEDKHLFMEKGVKNVSHVLVICTPDYVERANDRTRGVGEETSLITPGFYDREKSGKKFIPIVRIKVEGIATPDYLSSLVYVDFTNDLDSSYEELLRILYDTPKYQKPSRGKRPQLPQHTTQTSPQSNPSVSVETLHLSVINSEQDEWAYNDEKGIYIFLSNPLVQIRKVRNSDLEPFRENWTEKYPDPSAYRDLYDLYYNNNFIEQFFFVAVDGFRMSLPLPKSGRDLRVSSEQYQLGRILNINESKSNFDYYLNRAGIIVDPALCR